jgi:glucoamylase
MRFVERSPASACRWDVRGKPCSKPLFSFVSARSGRRVYVRDAALEAELGCPAGSLLLYSGDTYAAGNRWVLAALWLGLWHRQIGDAAGHERSLRYAVAAQTDLGLLPEQVGDDGEPAWIVPLAWSHAMFLLGARPELEIVRSSQSAAPIRSTV